MVFSKPRVLLTVGLHCITPLGATLKNLGGAEEQEMATEEEGDVVINVLVIKK